MHEVQATPHRADQYERPADVAEALELLAPVYDWFREGFDEAPLKEAKSELDELRLP